MSDQPRQSGITYLNEAINFDKRVIFIAVPKTGTTSVRSQLAQQGTPFVGSPHLNILQVRDCLYPYFLRMGLGKNRDFPSRDVPTDADIRAAVRDTFASFFKFSAVRNPWDRAVSLYMRREGVRMKGYAEFDSFVRNHFYASDTCVFPTLHRNQLDWLCDENGECIMDYVYKLEEFDSAVREIEERTEGRLRLEARRENMNRGPDEKAYREYYSDETRKLIATRFEKDIDYFKYTF